MKESMMVDAQRKVPCRSGMSDIRIDRAWPLTASTRLWHTLEAKSRGWSVQRCLERLTAVLEVLGPMRGRGGPVTNQRRRSVEKGGLAREAEWSDTMGNSERQARAEGRKEQRKVRIASRSQHSVLRPRRVPDRPDARETLAMAKMHSRRRVRVDLMAEINTSGFRAQNDRLLEMRLIRRRCGFDDFFV